MPQIRTVPLVGASMQPRIDSSVVLPLPEGPISTVSLPPSSDEIDVVQRLHLAWRRCRSVLLTFAGLDDRIAHRVSTIAGSTRTTRTIEASAEVDAHEEGENEQLEHQIGA